ncbi:DUF2996 domain-containing protein [aff. Roholtiella sp. LEGE 12411]|uniref:DUF2996 domain-containing protein n=1 Tax=aff. Roholtiella sp. LEGE 12411 TaxID=1828822 RepID=UPI00187F22A9|nr:DUF2996 domain-containing protein [aff. Roholtiella sp. LEGE 12411]MBE9034166.1 DUF2996 domain-containing protein [aff. Roholtiella sp. LEGE 12411]
MAEAKNHDEAGEVAPSTVDKQAPSIAEENAPSKDSPEATDLPTANAPDPEAANPETNPNTAKLAEPPKREKPAAAAGEKPAAKAAKKEKAPAVEDKPFVEFIQQDYLPALQKAIAQQGVQDLQVSFAKQKIPITGFESAEEYWQVIGSWSENGLRQFNLYFPEEDIQGKKGFSCNEGKKPSTLESFLIDERKITLDLLVYGLVQRLNGQKWLSRN